MDTLLLSRIQFGFTIAFHILFPTLTLGLSWFLAGFEAAWLRTRRRAWLQLYRFWVRIFALSFAMGVVSGLVLSYEIGTNFSRFSEVAGPVLGPLLSGEVLTAFFLEAGFIGIMLFGWDKVGPRLHFAASLLVALGTTSSAFWILAANSFMQTPQGAVMVNGHLEPQDWAAVIFNPSFPYRLPHMILASLLSSALVVSGVCAWHLRRRALPFARAGLAAGTLVLAVAAPLQVLAGDQHGLEVKRLQPAKLAAIEALWQTRDHVPLVLFALPDAEQGRNRYALELPELGSLVLTHSAAGVVRGFDQIPARDRPPILPVFLGFRVMVGLGFWFLFLGAATLLLRRRGALYRAGLVHRALEFSIPLGFVATVAGWIVAETGRQPWVVYGLLRTADAASPVAPQTVATSLALFVLVYGGLMSAYLFACVQLVRQGPPARRVAHPEAMRGAHPSSFVPKPKEKPRA